MKKTILGIIWLVIWVLIFLAPYAFGQDKTGTIRQDIKVFTADSIQAKQLDSLLTKHWANIKTAQQALQNLEAEKNKVLGYLQAEAVITDELSKLKDKLKTNKKVAK